MGKYFKISDFFLLLLSTNPSVNNLRSTKLWNISYVETRVSGVLKKPNKELIGFLVRKPKKRGIIKRQNTTYSTQSTIH